MHGKGENYLLLWRSYKFAQGAVRENDRVAAADQEFPAAAGCPLEIPA